MRSLLLLSLLALAACGAPSSSEDAGADAGTANDAGLGHDAGHDHDAGHEHDAGIDAGTADAGSEAFDLSVMFEAALARANNELHIELAEHGGAAISGATVGVALFMPDHGHGQAAPAVTEASPGHFHSMITFIMPGTWEVTVTATSSARVVTKKLTVVVP